MHRRMTSPKKKPEAKLNKLALFGGLGYTPHAGQLVVHRSKAKRRVLACGTRWGKSTLAAYECAAFLLEPSDKALGWLVAPTYELTRRVFERVVSILSDRMEHRVKSYDRRKHSIVVSNWGGGISELRARSADRPSGLLGDALDFLIVDEAVMIREDVWDTFIAPRLIDRHGAALLLSTPTSTASWFFREYKRAKKDSEYESFCMPTISNPHIRGELVEAERKRLAPEVFASQYEAKFTGIDLVPCDRCGGPRESAPCVVFFHEDEQPLSCAECGHLVGEDGLTRVSLVDGKRQATIIRFVGRRPPEFFVPSGVSRVLTMEDTPENIEDPDDIYRQVIIRKPIMHPEQLPDGIS